ncbi:hypothetical protein ACNO8S_01905 [Haloarcula sp. KBTZ06]|uniref:hypothetical protein n=1 Tax=Haloarcula sp. KBTZ06 TaxID=3402682 RepID=UPI003B43D4C9
MDWERGTVQPSLKEEILDIMQSDKDQIWNPAELRGEIYPDLEFPTGGISDFENQIEAFGVLRATSTIESLLEVLVAEGKVEKREFKVDSIAMITKNEKEYEEVAKQTEEEDVMTVQTFYKAT